MVGSILQRGRRYRGCASGKYTERSQLRVGVCAAEGDQRAWAQHDLLLIRLLDLNNYFGDKAVGELKAQLCRDFVDWSTGTSNDNNGKAGVEPRDGTVSDQTARRRLEDLRAAVNAYHAEHTLSDSPPRATCRL